MKVTHVPLVGAIWVYEGLSGYLSSAGKLSGSSRVSSLGGPSDGAASNLKRTSLLRSFTPRTPVGTNPSQSSLPQPVRDDRAKRTSRPATADAGFDSQDDLKALVLRLSSQIEELKAMVAEQQDSRHPGDQRLESTL